MTRKIIAGFAFALSVVLAASSFAGEPVHREIPYKKTVSLSTPKTYTFHFSIYDAAALGAGDELWFEEKPLRLTSKTLSYALGSGKTFEDGVYGPLDFSEQYWIQVSYWTGKVWKVIGVRDKFVIAPYALWSAAGGADSITTVAIADGTVRNEDIAPDAAIADAKLATIATPGKVADSALSGNVVLLDGSQTVTGLKTFATGSGAPFAIDAASSAMVPHLDAERLGGATLGELGERFVRNPAYTPGASYRRWLVNAVDVPFPEVRDSGISMTIGVDGLPLISWVGASALRVAHCGTPSCSAGNSIRTAAQSSPFETSIIVGVDGLPLVAYSAPTGDLRVSYCQTPDCSGSMLLSGSVSWDCPELSIMIGSDGLPVISCYSSFALRLGHCSEAHCSTAPRVGTIDYRTVIGSVGSHNSLTIGADGLPLIAYMGTSLQVAHCGNADCSSGNTISPVALRGDDTATSIAIGGDNLPVVAYSRGGPTVVHCASADCSAGASVALIEEHVRSLHNSLAIGTDGLPVIAYCDDHYNLKVAHCGNATCTAGNVVETVSNMPTAGCTYTALTIGADGLPVVAYYDRSDHTLKVAKLVSVPLGRR